MAILNQSWSIRTQIYQPVLLLHQKVIQRVPENPISYTYLDWILTCHQTVDQDLFGRLLSRATQTPGAMEISSQHSAVGKLPLNTGQDGVRRGLLCNYRKGLPASVGWDCRRQGVVGETETLSFSPPLRKNSLVFCPCYGNRMHGGW